MRRALLLATVLLAALAAAAAARGPNPDWPCQQALVPTLTAGMVWTGPSLEGIGDWHADPAVAALVARIAPRDVSTDAGVAAINEFVQGLGGDRDREVSRAFAGLLDETNRERGMVIDRLKELAERQRNLAALVSHLTGELDAIPANDPSRAAEREDLQQRWTFTSRAYTSLQSTMRYACEAPAALDARLGAYARALEAAVASR